MSYQPKPLDVSGLELGPELSALLERLAENTHETWARLRLQQGWTHGSQRDDADKKHPGLVPYQELSETEKDIDRETAAAVLKAILHFGYSVNAPKLHLTPADPGQDEALLNELSNRKNKLRLLRSLWEQRDVAAWSQFPKVYEALSDILCAKGESFWAYDVAAEGLRYFPGRPRLLQRQAWALAQSGATRAAEALLQGLRGAGHLDPETLGLLGRVYKDMAAALGKEKGTACLQTARDYYLQGFEKEPNSYNGINAATLTLLLSSTAGEAQKACLLADRAVAACHQEAKRDAPTLWLEATLGEAALVKGEIDSAGKHYAAFYDQARNDTGAIQSARAQARRILDKNRLNSDLVREWMPIPPIVLFAGQMFGGPEHPAPGFPQGACESVKARVRERLDQLDARISYSSAACGSDILFLEAMVEREAETNVVLPCSIEAFRETSVRAVGGEEWVRRFDAILPHISTLHIANHQDFRNSDILFEFGSRILLGLSRMKARILDTPIHPLVVWDGIEDVARQGTHANVRLWREARLEVDIIDLPGSHRASTAAAPPTISQGQQIKAVLIADVVGFSKLPEQDIPAYSRAFLGGVARLLESLPEQPLAKNTWGDAIYFVFETARGAGECALRLRDFMLQTEWQRVGLSKPIGIRIGLHAGPVLPIHDAVTGLVSFVGTNVNRAARIELISAEGRAYASEAFAALAESETAQSFACHYVGEKSLPKQAGILRIYQVDRITD